MLANGCCEGFDWLLSEAVQGVRHVREAHLLKSHGLYLADTLAGDAQLLADFSQGEAFAVPKTEVELDDEPFPLVQHRH